MPVLKLEGCTATPLGGYLKALGVLRLVAGQADQTARGWWNGETFQLESTLSREELLGFFLEKYEPTPIVAPWNGGSGFYPNDNPDGIEAISRSTGGRFASYREAIADCRAMPEVTSGKSDQEDERRSAILRRCRNRLSDRAVEWLDAAVGIAADGSRSFPPVLGTGGNEGRLDYTNNFMSRIAALIIEPDPGTPVQDLLGNSLFGNRTMALQAGAAGQFDPGRAGGPNQGPKIESEAVTNPWDLVLTLEGAVAWASGLYRRQGVNCQKILCSPFTVYSRTVGYGSAARKDEARAEIWTPLWTRPVRYAELKALLREGRASVAGRPAKNTLEFAEAAASLGVDRSIDRFVRYSLLKRRGDSFIALPAGVFPAGYRRNSDLIREFQVLVSELPDLPKASEDLLRNLDGAVYRALLRDSPDEMLSVLRALGRIVRCLCTNTDTGLRMRRLKASRWLEAGGFSSRPEVRIAAAVASLYDRDAGPIKDNLCRAEKSFAWKGIDLADRMTSVLKRRLRSATAAEGLQNPLRGWCEIDPGDATLFIEGSTDDAAIEELIFAFLALDWEGFDAPRSVSVEVLPIFALLKCIFMGGKIERGGDSQQLIADPRILSALESNEIEDAAGMALRRLRIARLRPVDVTYAGGVAPRRLAASLLIPVWRSKLLSSGIFHKFEEAHA